MNVLSVRGLTKAFGGVVAVNAVDLDLEAGELLALIGPNGAGKTTCFNLIGGQIKADSGSVRILGKETTNGAPRHIWRLGVGRTFQITATFASMTVAENVQMALISDRRKLNVLWPAARDLHRPEAVALLELVGLAAQADRPCGVLAYGDLKRVELAVALANRPKVLLMDEPTAGMAQDERLQLMGLAAGIVADRGIAVLFTEHDMDVVFAHADRIMVMDQGSVIARGTPGEVRRDAQVQRIYLGGGAEARP